MDSAPLKPIVDLRSQFEAHIQTEVVIKSLNDLLSQLRESQKIYDSYPAAVRARIESESSSLQSMRDLGMNFSTLSDDSRTELIATFTALKFVAEESLVKCELLSEDDIDLVVAFTRFMSCLGTRSKKSLVRFFESNEDGEQCWGLLMSRNKKQEARLRYRIPDDLCEFFELDKIK